MIIRPEEWWLGDRLKAAVFLEVRQLIFDVKKDAYASAPRQKTEITYDVADAVIAAAAVAVGWRDDPASWKDAATMLREAADVMEANGLRDLPWGLAPQFDPTPTTFPATLRVEDDYFTLSFEAFPEAMCDGKIGDAPALAQAALDNAILTRLVEGGDVPKPRRAVAGEVDVSLSREVAGKAARYWAYGQRPKKPS